MLRPRSLREVAGLIAAERGSAAAILFGTMAYSAGVMLFTVPFRLPDAGVIGIATLMNYALGTSIPLVYTAANAVLLLWAWRSLSPRLVVLTLAFTVVNNVMLVVMGMLPTPESSQPMLMALVGGTLKGLGAGLMFRSGGSTGGVDIVVLYLRKKYGTEVGKYAFLLNMSVLAVSIFIVGVENALLGVVGIYASSVMLDRALTSLDMRRQISVVTRRPQPVVDFISKNLVRGSTVLDAHGGYSGDEMKMIVCLLTRRQVVDLRRFIAESDPGAFMIVADASEVIGKGFKPWS